jgi:hypothetical protein
MTEWVPVGNDFIAADVIRWKEGVFKPRRSKKGKAIKLGERQMIAEVLRDEAGWVYLLVRGCEVMSATIGLNPCDVPVLAKGTGTKRKRATIVRGKPDRLLWSDESARALLASWYPGNQPPPSSEPKGGSKN